MITDRYYYSKLNAEEKKAYKSLYLAMTSYEKMAIVQKPLFGSFDISKVIFGVNMDNPLLYYVDFGNLRYSIQPGAVAFYISYYISSPEDLKTLEREVHNVTQKIMAKVTGNNSYELVCSVHDVLVRNVLYDMGALPNLQAVLLRSNTILGALLYKTAVCEGIAKTFKLILNMRDIPCIVAVGKANGGNRSSSDNTLHAWNIVRVNGCNFGVDVTWDINYSSKQMIRHDYLMLSNRMMSKDHEGIVDLPRCTTEGGDYFSKKGLAFTQEKELIDYLTDQVKKGNRAMEFRFESGNADPTPIVENAVRNAFSRVAHLVYGNGYRTKPNPIMGVFSVAIQDV